MPELVINYPDRTPERLQLGRLRITIGRSARNDVCVPDPFASRVHAEVRREGDQYFLQDLGSANYTFYNGSQLEQPVPLTHGDRIQIGETEIIYFDERHATNDLAGLVNEVAESPIPEVAISERRWDQTTAGLLEAIEEARRKPVGDEQEENDSHAPLWPGSVRLTPYTPQKPTGYTKTQISSASEPPLDWSPKYEALIPLKPIFRFIHEPIGPKTYSNFVGRSDELKTLVERILYSDSGSFLVTGYRGVGKTSFVNEVVRVLKNTYSSAGNNSTNSTATHSLLEGESYVNLFYPVKATNLGDTEVLDIHFNLARPLQPADLMHHIIRSIYQRLTEEGLFTQLDSVLREELKLAFLRTSMNMTRKQSETAESGFGLSEASMGAGSLKASLKTPFSYKKTKTRNYELTFLGYDDKAAEQDIIRISKALATGYVKKSTRYKRLLNWIRRRSVGRTALKIVFIFDELDKLEDFDVNGEGEDAHVIDEILGSLKNLFTTSGISFVFVAGVDLQERWLVDRGKGDSIYESVFSAEKYLPCMWSETDVICDRLVDWDVLRAGDSRRVDETKCVNCGYEILPKQGSCQRCNATLPGTDHATALFNDFKSYLAYKGRGIPRRVIRELNEHVIWEGGKPMLGFTRQAGRRIRFFAGLEGVLRDSQISLFGEALEEAPRASEDKRRLGVLYLIDWMLRQSGGRFTLHEATNAVNLLSKKVALGDGVATSVVKEIIRVLIKNDYLRQVRNPEDLTLAGGAGASSLMFELVPRRLAEMGSKGMFDQDDLMISPEPSAGSKLENYLLVKEIAKGGMGQVYEARDERDGRTVVVKMVASGFGLIKEINDRLKREANTLARLEHPNIVKYVGSGEADGRFFLVMEYIDGVDLGVILRSQGKLDLNLAMSIVLPVAYAIQYVHSRNLVRIDVKPGNILIGKNGHVYLIDFGTAKSKTPEGESITQIGSFVGTPNYMSPEQLKGAPPDERSDIYSFGIVLYESLVGRKPFVRELSGTNDTRVYEPPVPPSRYHKLPPELESLILKCLEPDPEKRFQTMGELIRELSQFGSAVSPAALMPVAENVAEQIIHLEHIERMETNPSVVEPLGYEYVGENRLDRRGSYGHRSILRFLNGPNELISDGFQLRDEVSIGRSAENDLVLDDPKVSRYNSKISKQSGSYWLQDLNPAHKTLVNNASITSVTRLVDKDIIQIGDCVFEFHDGGGNSSSTLDLKWDEGANSNRDGNKVSLLVLISKVYERLPTATSLDEITLDIARLVFEAVPAERCLIMLREGEGGELKVRAAEMRDRRSHVGEVRVSRTIVEEVVHQGRSVLTSDAQHDPRFRSSTVTFQNIRSVLAAPFRVGERIFGMIYADSPLTTSRFTEDHVKVLSALASAAAVHVENVRLLEGRLEQEQLGRELQLAREIQQRFQPSTMPTVEGYEMQGISFPSYQIGGDYYDFIPRGDGRLGIVVGDVSGRGVPAALLMSSLHAAVHAQVASCRPITETVGAVNRYLADNTPANRFVTLFYAELDPATGSLSFINAGHNPPIMAHDDSTLEQLGVSGLPLGIIPDFDYREGRTQLRPGDVLIAYSDGVTETQNPAGEEFGTMRLQDVITQNLDRSAAGLRDKIEAALSAFAQGTPAVDDITLVIVKRLEL